ncbi:hypothetical protein TSUD_262330 [Trifolium subterraneum]|nr:hypothetical protein TSUD_262330 [Trifolium subterraneum]
MLVDKWGLWFRVLAARYGVERRWMREGGRNGSSWWREIVRIRDGVERYGRLFDLAENKSKIVADMSSLGWEAGGGAWVWRRQLWWQLNPDRGYTVQGAYRILTSQQQITLGTTEDLIWYKKVRLKVSITAWRLLRDRLSTKSNLVTRSIITPGDHLCVSGCGGAESAEHLFLSCGTFGSLWSLVQS